MLLFSSGNVGEDLRSISFLSKHGNYFLYFCRNLKEKPLLHKVSQTLHSNPIFPFQNHNFEFKIMENRAQTIGLFVKRWLRLMERKKNMFKHQIMINLNILAPKVHLSNCARFEQINTRQQSFLFADFMCLQTSLFFARVKLTPLWEKESQV